MVVAWVEWAACSECDLWLFSIFSRRVISTFVFLLYKRLLALFRIYPLPTLQIIHTISLSGAVVAIVVVVVDSCLCAPKLLWTAATLAYTPVDAI